MTNAKPAILLMILRGDNIIQTVDGISETAGTTGNDPRRYRFTNHAGIVRRRFARRCKVQKRRWLSLSRW